MKKGYIMKKIISLLLIMSVLVSFAACKNGNNGGNNSEETTVNTEVVTPVVTLNCDKTEVAPGEEISVVVHVANAPKTACFDIYLYADEILEYKSASSKSIEKFQLEANGMTDADGKPYVAIRGIVATCVDILDNDIYTIKYIVSDNAVSGDEIEIKIKCPMFQVAFDENGNDVSNCAQNMEFSALSFTVS